MLAALLFSQDVRMAVFAGLVAGVVHRTGGGLGHGISAIVSILAETLPIYMLAALLFSQDVRMAVFAGLVAGVVHRTGGGLGHGISAIVSILAETLRHKKSTHPQKHQDADDENSG